MHRILFIACLVFRPLVSESAAVARVLASGYLIDAKAFELINGLPQDVDREIVAERLLDLKADLPGQAKVITEEDVLKVLPTGMDRGDGDKPSTVPVATEMEIVSDPTPAIAPAEASEGFNRLFRDRYDRLSAIARGRLDAKGGTHIAAVKHVQYGKKIKLAALLLGRTNRRNSVEVMVDDPTGTIRVVCQDDTVARAAMQAPLDCLVVMEVSSSKSGQLYANSLLLPDIPTRRPIASSHRVYAVMLSDLHIGSRMFLADDFERFLLWLNGKMGESDIVNRVKYLIIAGDLVDGVGVYPGQEFQLAEKDPKKQYEKAAELLKKVPNGIQIIISPGNHDAVRQALPQPAVSPDIADALYGMENVRWVGDPSYVKLHGVMFLIYHGKSMDDVIATTPELSYHRPTDAMKLLLRSRHLAPTYGKRTALSPELRDFLVIDPVPDVMHSGHVHTYGELNHRGTLLVNSGTWQGQTNFQSNMGIEPTPSIVPVMDLSTLRVVRRNFSLGSFLA